MKTCLACGFTGADVKMRVVKYDDPQPVQIAIRINERHGWTGQPEFEYKTVPGLYGAEWRCIDLTACLDRQKVSA